MSVRIASSFLKSPLALNAEERPIRAVKITPTADVSAPRRNFHLGMLLDTSGSMEGERITAVKTVMRLLIEALTDGDILTIVRYESIASVIASATVVDAASRGVLRDAVDRLHADGGTNLEAALVALRGVTSASSTPPVDAAFILTDGHINQGLMAASGLTRLLTASVPLGTPVFTLGFGHDCNSRMLRDMALRTRGSYTYADAAELIPATIADIISGLSTEIGRSGRLLIPDGWRVLEITAEPGAPEFVVGTLVSEKDQWIVLEGPVGTLVDIPAIEFSWCSSDGVEHAEICTTSSDFDPLEVAEQFCRCRVAAVQTSVQEMLEAGQIDNARAALASLGAELDASPAKDRTFVISLRATVDEMIDALSPAATPFARPFGGALVRAGAPSLAPILSRMASNTAALGAQRGFLSHINSTPAPAVPAPIDTSAGGAAGGAGARASHSGVTHMFCSPSQVRATTTMTERYSVLSAQPAHETSEEIDLDTVLANIRAAAAASPPTTPPRLARAPLTVATPAHPSSPTPPPATQPTLPDVE